MHVSPAASERSFVRSGLRDRTVILLASLTEAYPNQLAKALGISCYRLESVMHGRLEDGYSFELAPIELGLAEMVETRLGPVYRITPKGLRKARQLTSRRARRARFRATQREDGATRVRPRSPSGPVPAEASPGAVDTSSYRWSVEG